MDLGRTHSSYSYRIFPLYFNITFDIVAKQLNQEMLVDNSSISVISVHSKNKSANTKNSPSTSVPESPQLKDSNSRDFQSYDDYWTSECEGAKVRNLSKTIQDMDKNQDEMEKKFQQCIEHMLAEIERNNENNSRLAVEVNRLKTEVMESKKDILVIQEFINSSSKKEVKRRNGPENGPLNRLGSQRELFGSVSVSRNILGRRATSKFFKSKLLMKA